ncbi:hypothetical protein [Mucilaginibacter lappiensis]|uniref:hypothetical protein n=1 Tax=Mucilaginibacter lappiensis TaxID=354630 RepID=UPI003D24A3C7
MTDIFISHPTPFNEQQEKFLVLLESKLANAQLNPVNLGKKNWSYRNPMKPIKDIMRTCKGAVIIGLERFHSYIGYEFEHSGREKEYVHRYESTPWIHIEAGMAYQKGLPLLILKEDRVHESGILDPISSDYFIFKFDIIKEQDGFSKELNMFIESWIDEINWKN